MDASELVLNDRGALYHIDLLPGELAETIITVGDPDRVQMISNFFDKIHISRSHREFQTISGEYNGRPLSVISTGIGTDNIDIVLSEIDALFNIDLNEKKAKNHLTRLNFIRLGTSGALHPDIKIGDIVLSKYSVGLDNLLTFYRRDNDLRIVELEKKVNQQVSYPNYAHEGDRVLCNHFQSLGKMGITFSCPGFYGPQGRSLRLNATTPNYLNKLQVIEHNDIPATNFEMETSAIYGLSKLLDHRSISISSILANRIRGTFSTAPTKCVREMIEQALERIGELP
jgi:uridine phosphorylase